MIVYWRYAKNVLPRDGEDVLAIDALGNALIANYDGKRNVSVYDGADYPVEYTPEIKKWMPIPSA